MIKDFSDIIDQSNTTGVSVTFKLTCCGSRKILLVKAIQSATRIGLKEAKDMADFVDKSDGISFTRIMNAEELYRFKQDLTPCSNYGASYYIEEDGIRSVHFW